MLTFIRILLLIALSLVPSQGRAAYGGFAVHNVTTYSTATFPGRTVHCFTSTAIAPCTVGYSATCDGVADDSAKLATLVAAMVAGNPTPQTVIVDPGKRCRFASNNSFFWDGTTDGTPVADLIIWAYGATITTSTWIGGFGFFDSPDGIKNALIQTVAASSCTLNLISVGDASKFSANDYIMVGNLTGAVFGNPPTEQVSEYRQVVSVVGSVVTITPCLTNSYYQTYPAIIGGNTFQGGPATIWRMQKPWNTVGQVYGLTVLDGQTIVNGRRMYLKDVSFPLPIGLENSPAPTNSPNISFFNVTVGGTMEIDKSINLLDISNSRIFQSTSQSAGNTTVFTNTTFTGQVIGTDETVVFNNSTGPSIKVGPTNGVGGAMTLNRSTFAAIVCSPVVINPAALTYNGSGTFSIANNSASYASFIPLFYPGRYVYFSDTDGTNNSIPYTYFKVLSNGLRQDATNTYVDTDIPGALPTPTCNTHACYYSAAQISTLVNNSSSAPGLSGNKITCPDGANTIPLP